MMNNILKLKKMINVMNNEYINIQRKYQQFRNDKN